MFPKKLDQGFVNLLLLKEEGEQLEFKQQISSQEKIAKTLSAFANSKGGTVVIGDSDQRKIIGIDPEEERYMVAAANYNFCIPKVSLKYHVIKINSEKDQGEEKMVLLIEVHTTLGPQIFVRQKNGSSIAFTRIGNQSLVVNSTSTSLDKLE